MQEDLVKPSLLDEDFTSTPKTISSPKLSLSKDPMVFIFATACILALIAMAVVQNVFTKQKMPLRAEIAWSQGKPIIIQMGTSRVLEALLYSGHDNRTSANFKQVRERDIEWSVEPEGIVTVDLYGQISPKKVGQCMLRLRSLSNPEAQDKRFIQVVVKRNDSETIPPKVVKFKGTPAPAHQNLQKIVTRFSKEQIISSEIAPQTVKQAAQNPTGVFKNETTKGDITWRIINFANGSQFRYVTRDNTSMAQNNRDKIQHFMGDRYLPDNGHSPVMLETDDKQGVWVVGAKGNTNHIQMVEMSYSEKAAKMNFQTKACVDRHGITSSASKNGDKCIKNIEDNDGLWTSVYGAGELMKYAVLKERKAPQKDIEQARQSALRSLKAVLLISNVAGREGTIMAKIRYLNNSATSQSAVFYSKQYLLQGKQNSVDTYVGLPSDGAGFFGVDSNKTIDGDYVSGEFKYSMLPFHPEDWSINGTPATTLRHLGGFMARTFAIESIDPPIPSGGLFFKRSNSMSHKVLSSAHVLYDYNDTEHPQLKLGNKALPQVLKKHLYINGTQYNESDIVYKGDTSTDELAGHLFIYKIAYDILDDRNEEQKQLRQVIRQTMRNYCQHLINNGYTMVDGTGQATKWSKLYKQFLTSDFTIQDAPLKAIQLLTAFKLAHYVTGQSKWKEEYDMLANEKYFQYLDLVADLWPRWVWHFTKNDDSHAGLYKLNFSLNPSQIEIERHCIYNVHYSDEEEAFLTYYVAFQLEQDPKNIQRYKKGINGYWHSISRSENALWYYIYQTAFPEVALKDAYGQDLREVSAWQLSRHMIDTTKYQAYIKGSRNDVILEGGVSANPNIILGQRTSIQDQKYVSVEQNFKVFPNFNPKNIYQIKVLPADERSNHKFNGASFNRIDQNHSPNSVEASTSFSTPYWFGVYHNLLQFD